VTRIFALRGLFVVSMMVAVVVCATVAFVMIRNLQEEIGVQTYESIATSALASAKAITKRKLQAGKVMSTMLANLFPRADDWPMIDINGYYSISNEVATMASDDDGTLLQIGLLVVVEPGEEAFKFEEFAKDYYRGQEYPSNVGSNEDSGFGIRISREGDYVLDRDGTWTTYGSKNKVLTPVLDHSTWNSSMLLYNAHVSSTAVDGVIECSKQVEDQGPPSVHTNHSHFGRRSLTPHCGVVSGFRIKNEELVSLIYIPIYPSRNQSTLVGLIGLTVNFADVIHSVIPDYFDGIYAVLSTRKVDSDDHSTVAFDTATFKIVHGIPKLVGEGDLHPDSFTKYGKSIDLNDLNEAAPDAVLYTLTLYPSSFDQYETASAAAVAAGLAAVVLACGISFVLYDSVVRQESNKQRGILTMRRRFVRFISHEIRTPLNTVCMGIELLLDELQSFHKRTLETIEKHCPGKTTSLEIDEQAFEFWQEITQDIKDNAAGAVGILNDLLNYDKVESSTLHIEANLIKITDLVRKTTHRFKVQAVNRDVSLNLRVQNDVSSLMIVGDEMRLGEVLSNLISNAFKFTPSGGTVNVDVRPCFCCKPNCPTWKALTNCRRVEGSIIYGRPPVGSLTISVSDSGVGMTQEQIAQIFKEGVQFDANKLQAGGGSGLGLCIAKGIIDRHNGVISAESQGIGKGSTFTVILPLQGDSHHVSGFGGRLVYQSPEMEEAVPPEITQYHNRDSYQTTEKRLQSDDFTLPCSITSSTQSPDHSSGSSARSTAISLGLPQDTIEKNDNPCAAQKLSVSEVTESLQATDSTQCQVSPQPQNPQVETPTERPKHRILVVEDVLASRKMLVRLLKRAGHECTVACNGQEAIDEMRKVIDRDVEEGSCEIDTILMDFEMPVLNGPNATLTIRSLGYQGLIFGLTGNLLKEDVDHFMLKGADDVFPKPFDFSLLNEAWERFT